jgi:hypothetical protein
MRNKMKQLHNGASSSQVAKILEFSSIMGEWALRLVNGKININHILKKIDNWMG